MIKDQILAHRRFMTDALRREVDFSRTDQNRGVPAPKMQKTHDPRARLIRLAGPEEWAGQIGRIDLAAAIGGRKSRRHFSAQSLELTELAFLLWATQGVRKVLGRGTALRNVPSAGSRHSFETYLFIGNVAGVPPGLYRFLPFENQLVHIRDIEEMGHVLGQAAYGQKFVGTAAVTFAWACIPYRTEWRYGLTAHRVMLLDAGHVCQNLYLACEAIDAGTCAIGAYDQQAMDELIGLDGEEEFTLYLAPVGKRAATGEQ